MAAFGAEGYVFVVEAEGGSYYLYRVKEDGTERRKAVEDPTLRSAIVGDPFDVSADGSWVSITVGLPAVDERRFIVKAYPSRAANLSEFVTIAGSIGTWGKAS